MEASRIIIACFPPSPHNSAPAWLSTNALEVNSTANGSPVDKSKTESKLLARITVIEIIAYVVGILLWPLECLVTF